VSRSSATIGLGLILAALLVSVGGCRKGSKTPAEAYKRFAAAVTAGDGGALFDALDQDTRWSLMTVQKWHREAYDIVLSNYPEGPDRERERRRFEEAATAPSARELFMRTVAPRLIPLLVPLALGDAPVEMGPGEDRAAAVLASGGRVELARGKDGGWGFAGYAKRAEEDKNRAYNDLEVVRASAADFERAAARAGR
jgi:hypothetical protein